MTKITLLKYALLPVLLLVAACSNGADEPWVDEQRHGTPLEIEVQAGDFNTVGKSGSRATDNGASTSFEQGDRLGLTILDADGNIIANNVPYIYVDGNWTFDNSNDEGKEQCRYRSQATYLAYFPYSSEADGAGSVDDLKARFVPAVDQSTAEAYRASDLMTASGVLEGLSLSVTLTHAYASVSARFLHKIIMEDDSGTEIIRELMTVDTKADFNIGGKFYSAYRADDGSFHCILPSVFDGGDIVGYYNVGDRSFKSSMTIQRSVANTRYVTEPAIEQPYTLDNATAGDYYCLKNDGGGYLIPGSIESLTDAQKQVCVGIVYKVGAGKGDNADLYDGKLTDGIHGYVVALTDALLDGVKKPAWSIAAGSTGVSTDKEAFDGYSNTKIITAKENYESAYPAFAAGVGNNNTLPPTGTSGWYLPSAGQMMAIEETPDRSLISDNIKKAGGNVMKGYDNGWTSTESASDPSAKVWHYFAGWKGLWDDIEKTATDRCFVRSVLTF